MKHGSQLQQGFSFLELIAVVVIIAVLAASGLVYYQKALQDARRTGLEMLAHRFTAAVALAHAQWIIQGGYNKARAGKRSTVDMDNVTVHVNEFGWPANTDGQAAGSGDQSAEECYQVWQAVLQNPALATVEGRSNPQLSQAEDPRARGRRHYHISQLDGRICRYELVVETLGTHYFDYTLATGQVLITVPPRD